MHNECFSHAGCSTREWKPNDKAPSQGHICAGELGLSAVTFKGSGEKEGVRMNPPRSRESGLVASDFLDLFVCGVRDHDLVSSHIEQSCKVK